MAPLLTERGLFVEGKTNHICCKLRKNQIQGKVASQILNSLHQVMLIKICCLCVRSTVFRDAKYHSISLIFYIYTAQKLRRKYLREFLRLLYRKRHHAVDLHDQHTCTREHAISAEVSHWSVLTLSCFLRGRRHKKISRKQ